MIMDKMLIKKRGYFFVLDATLGLFALTIGVLLVLSFYANVPAPTQVSLLSNDLLRFLSKTKIKELNNPYAGIGGELWKQDTITDADNSLLQQIGEFYYKNSLNTAEKFIQNVSEQVLPSQFKFEVWIDNVRLYPRNPTADHVKSRDNSALMLTSKRVTFGIFNRTTSEIWGPYKVEVFLWEK